MKKTILLLVVITFTLQNTAQNKFDFFKYWSLVNEAKIANYNKHYENEKKLHEKSFKYGGEYFPGAIELLDYAGCLLSCGDTLAASKNLRKVIIKGNTFLSSAYILENYGKYGPKIVEEFPKLEQEFLNSIPTTKSALEIRELAAFDQSVRIYLANQFPTPIRNRILEITDSVNFDRLYKMTKYENADPTSILMWHLYDDNNIRYFTFYDSIFKAKVFNGKTSPNAYVQWHDRQRMYVNNLPTQLYGEWNEPGSNTFNPIEDIENVDNRRAIFGLAPLKDYALLHNMILPKEYMPPKPQSKK